MAKYRKKPVVIEAWLWDESRPTFAQIGCAYIGFQSHSDHPDLMQKLRIRTLEGVMSVNKGDYIIKGVKGEFYPCKPDIFALTYESV
jgi:hypothetical protein